MSSFLYFEEEKRSSKEDTENWTCSKNAISKSEKNVGDDLEMKDAAKDTVTKHNEGSEDGKKKGYSCKMFVFFN